MQPARRPVLVVMTAVAVVACEGNDSPVPPPAPTPLVEAERGRADAVPPRAAPGVLEDGTVISAVDWFEGTLEQALAAAGRDNKLVFMDVGAYWCPPCHELDEKTFVDPTVGEALKQGFLALHIDAEKGEGPELVERYRIQAYPTLLVLEPSGVEKGRAVDFLAPEDLLGTLDTLAKGENVLSGLIAQVEKNPDDLEKRYALGHAYALAANRDRAQEAFQAVMLGDPRNEMGLAAKVAYDRAQFLTEKLDRDYERAISEYRRLQSRFPKTAQATRAHRKIARALHHLGKDKEAIDSVLRMVAADSGDVNMHANVGWFCFRNKVDAARGLAVVNEGLAVEPDNAELHYLAAELHARQGDHPAASVSIHKASQAEPKSNYYKRQVRRFAKAVEAGSGATPP